jgi:hypothetical protein
MELRTEEGRDFIYGARNVAGEGIKIEAETGAVVLKLGIPTEAECGLKITKWSPTAITVAPDGEIYLSDGYASNRIFRFGPDGTYRAHFGFSAAPMGPAGMQMATSTCRTGTSRAGS